MATVRKDPPICPVQNKRSYASHGVAMYELFQARRQSGADPTRKENRVYLCTHCKHWHITSQGRS